MPRIRPFSDLRTKAREIARQCRESHEPIILTHHGRGDLVLMTLAAYERNRARMELYGLIEEAEEDLRRGDRGISVESARRRLRR